jgi:hypothetical protein
MDAAAARLSSLLAETDLLPRTRARRPPSIVFVVVSDTDNFDSAASIVLSRIPWSALELRERVMKIAVSCKFVALKVNRTLNLPMLYRSVGAAGLNLKWLSLQVHVG